MSQIITSIEAGRTRSWVDPLGARELSSLVQRELHKKFDSIQARDGKVYFITGTYDPSPWLPDGVEWAAATLGQREEAAEKCWDAMTSERHVHHFFKRLEITTGLDLCGRWWSKREFTKNGFLHHHIILDGPDYLPFDLVHEAWGHGRVDCQVAKTAGGLAWYVGKYCTKYGDEPPAFIMNRPTGSLRFTTCSDGWWSSDRGTVPASRSRRVGGRIRGRTDRAEDAAYGCYETVGQRIARKARSVTVRCNGEREEIQGVTLEEFRFHRDPSYARSVIKARASMDAIVGLSMSQACRELREIAAHVRTASPPPGVAGAVSVSDAGPLTGGMPCGPVRPSQVSPLFSFGSHPAGGEKTPPGRVPAAGGIAAVTGRQMSLYTHDACHGSGTRIAQGERSEALGVPAAPALRSNRGVAEPSVMARGLLTLSSPQECGEADEVKAPIDDQGIPPDI